MTALSLMVPLFALAFAFWFLGDEAEYSLWRLPFAGVFVGLTSEYTPGGQQLTYSRTHALLGCLPTTLPDCSVYCMSTLIPFSHLSPSSITCLLLRNSHHIPP
jgi:hypothetical protein